MKNNCNIKPVRSFRSYFMSILFIAVITIPLMNTLFNFIPDSSINENRNKSSFPTFQLEKLDSFPKEFEAYTEDHFCGRNYLLNQYMRINLLYLHTSTIVDKAIVGTDGWFFMSGFELENYRGDSLFTPAELKEFTDEISRRDSIVQASGAKYYFVIVPSKHSVYPEYLPSFARKRVEKNNPQLVIQRLEEQGKVRCIYLLDSMLHYKTDQYPLYSKTDNHWNHLGAFYAVKALTEIIRRDFPAIKPLSIKEYHIKVKQQRGGNIAEMFGMQDELSEEFISLEPVNPAKAHPSNKQNYPVLEGFAYPDEYEVVYETGDESLPKMLIIRESFAGFAAPYLSENASKAVFIFDAWQHKFNNDIFVSEQPNIYIQFVMEGFLRQMLRYSRVEKTATPAR